MQTSVPEASRKSFPTTGIPTQESCSGGRGVWGGIVVVVVVVVQGLLWALEHGGGREHSASRCPLPPVV